MRITQTFTIACPPEAVFDYVTDVRTLRDWQTSKTRVEALTAGPPRQGYRVREWTKPPGMREFQQIAEFAEFDRPHRLRVKVVEGPQPIDGTWTFTATETGTRVLFVAEGALRGPMRLAGPIVARVMSRQFAHYHDRLRHNLEVPAV
ncbi:SRPBCC family protein [Solirubrobacter soli]|uniref:SRPBCC family protein n=1 Tax=Solirubrobacter soli TaxID=363832 RepID=UPI0003F73D71|nr:SRPBCC family protein [Solirubrobacter soli]